MNKTKVSFLLIGLLLLSFFSVFASATITVPSTTYFTMPALGTQFNFASEQIFNEAYFESASNSTYPSFWFITTVASELFGLQGTCNFTVSTFFSSQLLTFTSAGAGVVNVYCGSWGSPVTVSGASFVYVSATKIASLVVSSASTVTLSWVVAPTPTPTPPPSPVPVVLSINQPLAATYAVNQFLVSLTASGGTVNSMWFNVVNGSGWIYAVNQTYTGPVLCTGFTDGSYILYAGATNTDGFKDLAEVSFSISVPSVVPLPVYPTITINLPQNVSLNVASVMVDLSSTNALSTWYNVKNGSTWLYSSNRTYTASHSISSFVNGSYTFYAWAGNNYGVTGASVMFSVGLTAAPLKPQILNVHPYWQFLLSGNILGFLQAIYIGAFILQDILVGVICMLFLVPLYLKTKSLWLLCVLWILLGGFFIALAPSLSGLAVIFLILGVGGVLWKLVKPNN